MSFANYVPNKILPKEETRRIHQKINAIMDEFFQKLQTISQGFVQNPVQEMIFYKGRSFPRFPVISWTGSWVIVGTCPSYNKDGELIGFEPAVDLIRLLFKDKTIQSTEVTVIDENGFNENWEKELKTILEKSIPCYEFAVKHEHELMNERKVNAIKEAAEKYES